MSDKKSSRFITLHLGKDIERKVRVPNGLERAFVPPGFVDSVFDTVARQFAAGGRRRKFISNVSTSKGFGLPLEYFQSNGTLSWRCRLGDDVLACGYMTLALPYWQEVRAASVPEARGKGLYRAVLLQLRKDTKRKLISDASLTDANILIWSAIGEIDDNLGRFRINPGPSSIRAEGARSAALSIARSIVAMEVQ